MKRSRASLDASGSDDEDMLTRNTPIDSVCPLNLII